MATTPIAPVRLSFMISNALSRGLELSKPSALSARPSRCKQPEINARKPSMQTAATLIGKKTQRRAARTYPRDPIIAPTRGKK